MAVTIKSESEIAKMREAGRLLALMHEELHNMIRPGITTMDINKRGEAIIRKFHCIPNFLHQDGFPASICVSLNDEVVHGVPSKFRVLEEGDIVSLDAGLIYEGYHSDAARTWPVGKVSPEAERLMRVTRESFFQGIQFARPGYHIRDISKAIQTFVEGNGFSVVRDLVGHGIGRSLHEDPGVPNFVGGGRGIRLQKGMTLAIEPMVNAGRYDVWWLENDMTVATEDGSLSAHYENTVLITDGEPEILTLIGQEEI